MIGIDSQVGSGETGVRKYDWEMENDLGELDTLYKTIEYRQMHMKRNLEDECQCKHRKETCTRAGILGRCEYDVESRKRNGWTQYCRHKNETSAYNE